MLTLPPAAPSLALPVLLPFARRRRLQGMPYMMLDLTARSAMEAGVLTSRSPPLSRRADVMTSFPLSCGISSMPCMQE